MEITFLVKDIAARRVRNSRLVWKVGGDTAAGMELRIWLKQGKENKTEKQSKDALVKLIVYKFG